ncbi:hypothetical protein CMV_003089 [Castanea mollissima]|uniref:Uncharacterized protein n=1 Tax=Castanea mollissima TaxID=60419 RepID=A0A8J4RI27_9ROSI|nr:hypothetical protein CMV_003089 [Castanea mollissima]
MSSTREGNQNKKVALQPKAVSWQEKKSLADNEEKVLQKEIEDLRLWAEMMDTMKDEQLKEYLYNRPNELKTVKIQKSKPRQRVQRVEKSCTSDGILASVWKFHKEEDEDLKSDGVNDRNCGPGEGYYITAHSMWVLLV